MARTFMIGDKVRITPSEGDGTCNCIRKYSGRVGVISGIRRNKMGAYYTLSGYMASEGMPYFFCGDWLTPLEGASE